MDARTKRLKYACYTSSVTMAAVANLSPLLFVTFRTLYGISYSLLGLLVLINFSTQLLVDLLFSFFSHKFNIPKVVKSIPALAGVGLLIYAVWPWLCPGAIYPGLVVGTILFSASAGLGEVFGSPIIAALPAQDPDREMSKFHSTYAWGLLFVVLFGTLFLFLAGKEHWQWLALLFILIPLLSAILFSGCEIPKIETPAKVSGAWSLLRDRGVWLCITAIFLGGATECTMSQWSSSYLEQALGLPKLWGDVFGVALFSVMLGLGRSLYSKIGRNLGKILTLGMLGSALCYLAAALGAPALGLFACAFTGFCASMLWPGNLVVASERFPSAGLFIYAIMAAGGDLGASVAPQLVGIVADTAMASADVVALAGSLGLTDEQLGMKLGMLTGMFFPLAGFFVQFRLWKITAVSSKQ